MTMSRGINIVNFITKVQVQRSKINPINFYQRQGSFEDIGAIVELEGNMIISHGYLFSFSILYYFEDFLLLGTPSLCTKTPIHGQNLNTNIL